MKHAYEQSSALTSTAFEHEIQLIFHHDVLLLAIAQTPTCSGCL